MNDAQLLQAHTPDSEQVSIYLCKDIAGLGPTGYVVDAIFQKNTGWYYAVVGGTVTHLTDKSTFVEVPTAIKSSNMAQGLPQFTIQEELLHAYRPLTPINIPAPQTQLWQTCPVCDGTGKVWAEQHGINLRFQNCCQVCEGKRIISTLTGLPPAGLKEEPAG